ncbi:MAG: hypothetical protein ACFBQW_06860 [Sphingomonadaceae bacterium]
MRMPVVAAAALGLAACAGEPALLVERGYQPGSLAVGAIQRGDYQAAEQQLLAGEKSIVSNGIARPPSVDSLEEDPARLINLGLVYARTGRTGAALTAWRRALAADRHFLAELGDGRVVATDALARSLIAAHDPGIRSATVD